MGALGHSVGLRQVPKRVKVLGRIMEEISGRHGLGSADSFELGGSWLGEWSWSWAREVRGGGTDRTYGTDGTHVGS